MPVRKQTLEEWFLNYQLRAIARAHVHLPMDVEIDVTRLVTAYAERGARPPLTAITIKAAALLAERHPEVNRAVLATPLGARVVQFEGVHVNVPIMMEHDGVPHLSATVIRDANRLTVPQIQDEMRKARERRLSDLPIGKLFIKNENTALNRARLRLRHAVAYGVPALFEKYAGGISVSSLFRAAPEGVLVRMPSFGPTALSFAPGALRTDADGRRVFTIGVGYDHLALGGRDCVRYLDAFGSLLATGDLAPFLVREAPSMSPKAPDA